MRNIDVIALAHREPTGLAADLLAGSEVVVGDAGVGETVERLVAEADHVVLAVSSLMPGEADANPALDMTLMLGPLLATLHELTKYPEIGVTLLSSGGTVYGDAQAIPTPESAPTNPMSAYGITKLAASAFVLRHAQLHGSPTRILRLANAYGPGQLSRRGQGVIGGRDAPAVSGQPLVLFGDGTVSRDFVHVDDIAYVTAELLARPDAPTLINVGSGSSASVNEVVELVQDVTGVALRVERQPARAFDVQRVQLDIDRLRSLVQFDPTSLQDGVRGAWEHVANERTPAALAEQRR